MDAQFFTMLGELSFIVIGILFFGFVIIGIPNALSNLSDRIERLEKRAERRK